MLVTDGEGFLFLALPILNIVKFRSDKHNVVLCLNGTRFLVLVDKFIECIETLSVCKIKHDDCTLTIAEVAPSQCEELFLPLSVPDLQPHSLVLDLKR